jgi:integrase
MGKGPAELLLYAGHTEGASYLTVNQTPLQSPKGGVPAWGTPKAKRSRRTLTLLPKALTALKAHRQQQLEQRVALGPDYAPYNLVFASGTGTPLMHRNVHRSFKAALKRAGLAPSVRFHDLRHAAATMMLQAGIPLKQVSEWLGHNQISTTAHGRHLRPRPTGAGCCHGGPLRRRAGRRLIPPSGPVPPPVPPNGGGLVGEPRL